MFNKLILTLVTLLATSSISLAANYIEAEELKQIIQQKKDVIIIDIQPGSDFEKQHLPGSIETNAFPAKTDEEKQRLNKALSAIAASKAPVVIICPRGKSGAKNSYEYLLDKGISEERLLILDDGIAGWPFKELLKQGR